MSQRQTAPFRADHVGSFLRPPALLAARDSHAAGKLDDAGLRAAEDAAIREVVAFQESVGLQGITDGEYRRTYFHIDFLEQIEGIEAQQTGIASHFHTEDGNLEFAPPKLKITGKVRHAGRSMRTISRSCAR